MGGKSSTSCTYRTTVQELKPVLTFDQIINGSLTGSISDNQRRGVFWRTLRLVDTSTNLKKLTNKCLRENSRALGLDSIFYRKEKRKKFSKLKRLVIKTLYIYTYIGYWLPYVYMKQLMWAKKLAQNPTNNRRKKLMKLLIRFVRKSQGIVQVPDVQQITGDPTRQSYDRIISDLRSGNG